MSKRWFGFRDTYGVDIADGENDVLILACTVVIDLATEKKDNDERHGDAHLFARQPHA